MAGWFPLTIPAAQWQALKVGAGGFLRTLSVANDGSYATGADTYGAWVYNSAIPNPGNAGGTGAFQQVVNPSSIPSSDPTSDLVLRQTWGAQQGVYEFRFAPSNSQIMYMIYMGYMFKSTNKGTNWTNQSGWTNVTTSDASPNPSPQSAGSPEFGPRMAIHPTDPNTVFVGLQTNGALKTTNGGTTWTAISTSQIANPTASTGIFFCFDANTPANMFAFSYGVGCYKSTDTGSNWTKISGTGTSNTTLTTCARIKVDPNGNLWALDNAGSQSNVWKYNGTSWANPTTVMNGFTPNSGTPYHDIAFDPTVSSPLRILLVDQQLYLTQSVDGGTTWFGSASGSNFGPPNLAATDIPYLALSVPITGYMDFLPGTANLIISTGVGIYTATPPSVSSSANTWTDKSTAIEQLVANMVRSPPNGPVFLTAWDRANFVVSDFTKYAITDQPTTFVSPPGGSGIDYAKTDPTFLVSLRQGGTLDVYSSGSWSATKTYPIVSSGGGGVAALSTTALIVAQYNGGSPQVTSNGGTSWTDKGTYFNTNFSIPVGTGWNAAGFYVSNDQIVCAESATIAYIYNSNSQANGGGIYKTADAGATWTRQSGRTGTGIPAVVPGGNPMLREVPNKAGHIIWCGGQTYQGVHPYTTDSNCYISTDGGVTMTDLSSSIRDVWAVGAGKQVGSYPRIVIWGYKNVSGTWTQGVWYSDDQGSNWSKIGEQTLYGTYDVPKWLEVNQINNEIYIGLTGSGWARYGV